ncbi:MAG TPA: HK97 family phage prohead protease [Pirellulales bacterium]|nr:HK97 family phage prohead protease [Pirellulales bacterium]
MQFDQLLETISKRTVSLGIGTAAAHLREMEVCLDGVCPSRVLAGMSRRRWQGLLKRASRQLVYQHPEMRPRAAKAIAGNRLPPHTIATFPAIVTTTRQDRDGDVLETKGAELDPGAPLLWQHLPTEPIGRLLGEGKRTSKRLTGSFSICGTPLGEDAAMLAEHGALDISHGFLPSKWEPLDEADPLAGYHVLEFKILEVSLVSVPSNPDAVIEAFSREKLQHPLVKAWAGARFARRPVISASGIDLAPPAAVLASNENDAQDDDDGDMSLHGGDPANSAPVGASVNASIHARSLLADAQSLLCRMAAYECVTGDATPLEETSQRFREIANKVGR